MAAAKTGDTVTVHYTGTLDDGSQFDSSRERAPFEFTLGSGSVIPGFEEAVVGLEEGETKKFRIEPGDAYGDHQAELVQTIERSNLPPQIELEKGLQLQASRPDGGKLVVTVKDFDSETVTLDANHELAGEALNFEIELLKVA
jgi:FKBP-type peptidyl-prolyl cis-trans isomerase 2